MDGIGRPDRGDVSARAYLIHQWKRGASELAVPVLGMSNFCTNIRPASCKERYVYEKECRYPLYAAFDDLVQGKLAIIRLHAEDWSVKSIAGYFGTSRKRIYSTIKRWIEEQFAGLPAKSSPLISLPRKQRWQRCKPPRANESRTERIPHQCCPRTIGDQTSPPTSQTETAESHPTHIDI